MEDGGLSVCDKKEALQKYRRPGWALPVVKQGCLSLGQNEQFQPPDTEDTSSESFGVLLWGGWDCSGVCLGRDGMWEREREREGKQRRGLGAAAVNSTVPPRVWETGLLCPRLHPCLFPAALLSFLLPNLYFLIYKIIQCCTSLKAASGHPSFCPVPPTVVLLFQRKNRLGEGSPPAGGERAPSVRSVEALGWKQSVR